MVIEIIIPAILAFLGIIFKNKWLAILGVLAFLFMAGLFVTLPPYVIIVVVIIIFFWIRDKK